MGKGRVLLTVFTSMRQRSRKFLSFNWVATLFFSILFSPKKLIFILKSIFSASNLMGRIFRDADLKVKTLFDENAGLKDIISSQKAQLSNLTQGRGKIFK